MLVRRLTVKLGALTVIMAAGMAGGVPARGDDAGKPEKFWVYVGSYTGGAKSKGIYRFELDAKTGTPSEPKLAAETANPSFLAIAPDGRFLYAVGEYAEGQKRVGAISAFSLDPKTGDLTLLNQQSSGGGGPCHVVIDKKGRNVFAANYGGGSACVLPVHRKDKEPAKPDAVEGSLAEASAVVQHEGSSVNKKRQAGPHAHSINLSPDNRFAFVADLGLDKVMVYRVDADKGTLTAAEHAPGAAAAGPRHFAFHPNGKFAYVINEIGNTITVFDYDADSGKLTTVHSVTTLPSDFSGISHTAEVVVHPSGKFVYGSNRGHDSIAIFKADSETGRLTAAGHQGEGIKEPRNFNIDPTGAFLLVGNQNSDSIKIFRIDPADGSLSPTGHTVAVGKPVCIKFLAAPKGE